MTRSVCNWLRYAALCVIGASLLWTALPRAVVTAQEPVSPLYVGIVRGFDFSPDSSLIALGYTDRVEIRELATGASIREIPAPVRAQAWGNGLIDWHPSRALLATGDRQSVIVWDAESGAKLRTFELKGRLSQLVWHPEGETVIVGLLDGTLAALDMAQDAPRFLMKDLKPILALSLSPDGSQLAFSQYEVPGEISVLDLSSSKVQHFSARSEPSHPVVLLSWSPEGTALVGCTDQGDMRGYTLMWDALTGKVSTPRPLQPATMFAWHPRESILAAVSVLNDAETDQVSIKLYDLKGVTLVTSNPPEVRPHLIGWAEDTLVIVDVDGYLHLWSDWKK